MTDKQIKKLHCFIKFYGKTNQCTKAIEECAELQQQLCKALTGTGSIYLLAEEIADVTIMLEQLKIMFNCSDDVNEIIDYKIQRQIERMAKQ